jgi:hypothetical protein
MGKKVGKDKEDRARVARRTHVENKVGWLCEKKNIVNKKSLAKFKSCCQVMTDASERKVGSRVIEDAQTPSQTLPWYWGMWNSSALCSKTRPSG